MKKTVKIAILGLGTIGSATYKNILKNSSVIKQKTGIELLVTKALEKEPERFSHLKQPGLEITNDFSEILNDTEIDIIVELMGGKGFAKDCALKAIEAGKHVVTANKAMVAEHLEEFSEALKKNQVSFAFEAAVAGGIPVISAVKDSFAGNSISKVLGILNGTCNYILTEMAEKGLDFPDVLKDAQEKGFAEADPTFDIEGIDAAHKISILSALAFMQPVDFTKLNNIQGITKITSEDIEMAKDLGLSIKLIASAEICDNKPNISVGPCLVSKHHPLSSVEGVYNAVFVEGDPVGKTMFYGKGAGGDATSSAVIADIINIAQLAVAGNINKPLFYSEMGPEAKLSESGNPSRFYIRIVAIDQPGVLAKIAGVLGRHNISIATVYQNTERSSSEYVPIFLTTHEAEAKNMTEACKEIADSLADAGVKDKPFVMKIIE